MGPKRTPNRKERRDKNMYAVFCKGLKWKTWQKECQQMSREFGAKLSRALGAFLRNLDLISLVNGDSENSFKCVFSNNYLVTVRKIDSQSEMLEKEVSCTLQRQGKGNVTEEWT